MSFPKIDPIFKKKWMSALRELKDRKCVSKLFDGQRYCAMGVAHYAVYGQEKSSELVGRAYLNTSYSCVPSELFQGKGNGDIQQKIVAMNDSDKKSFEEIADWIDENL